jgi:hypothetical protein
MNPKISYLKIDVSCEACVNFHHISQNARPVSPGNGIRKKKSNTTCLKSAAPATQMTMEVSKVCACREKCQSSSQNLDKVLRRIAPVTQKTTFDTS